MVKGAAGAAKAGPKTGSAKGNSSRAKTSKGGAKAQGRKGLPKTPAPGVNIGDAVTVEALKALSKTTGKKGGRGTRKSVEKIVRSDQDYKTKRTMYRSAAAASSAAAYANNMNGGLIYLSEKKEPEDGSSGSTEDTSSTTTGQNKGGSGQRPGE